MKLRWCYYYLQCVYGGTKPLSYKAYVLRNTKKLYIVKEDYEDKR